MSRIHKLSFASLLLICSFCLATAKTGPDINGTWKMNPSKSRFTSKPGPQDLVDRFEQQGTILRESLTIVNSKGTSTTTYNYTLDGREIVNVVDGEKVTVTARWDAKALVIEWKDEGGTFSRRFTFSENGNTLSVELHDSDGGESNDIVVLERQ